jgi:hypothetical protein
VLQGIGRRQNLEELRIGIRPQNLQSAQNGWATKKAK